MFSLNEKVVYPGHGVAKINRIIDRIIAGKKTSLFELTFLNKEMTILVPVSNIEAVGIRPLSSLKMICDLLDMIEKPVHIVSSENVVNWNKRHKGYMEVIRRGDLHNISSIYRELKFIESQKELSFGEKSLLHQTEELLIQEIALVRNVKPDAALAELRSRIKSKQCIPSGSTAQVSQL